MEHQFYRSGRNCAGYIVWADESGSRKVWMNVNAHLAVHTCNSNACLTVWRCVKECRTTASDSF